LRCPIYVGESARHVFGRIHDVVTALALEGWSSDEILLAIGDVSDVLLATCLETRAQEALTT
jgi:hypothetical protein